MNLNNVDIEKLDFSVIEDDLDSIYEQLDKIHNNKKLMKIYNEYIKEQTNANFDKKSLSFINKLLNNHDNTLNKNFDSIGKWRKVV